MAGVYEEVVDRESAWARCCKPLRRSGASGSPHAAGQGTAAAPPAADRPWYDIPGVTTRSGRSDSLVETMAKTAVRTMGTTVGRQLVRGIMGSLLGGATTKRR